MKAKIKSGKKDINIDIKIENNLMSKNKMKPSEDENNELAPDNKKPIGDKGGSGGSAPPASNNMSRLLSDYYGVMAQRDLYRSTQQQSPFNFAPLLMAPNSMNQNANQGLIQNQNADTSGPMIDDIDEEDDNELEQSINQINQDNEDEDFGLNEDSDVVTFEKGYEFVNRQQEIDEVAKMNLTQRKARTGAIRRIKIGVRVRKDTIKKFFLAKYVKKYNPTYWASIEDIGIPPIVPQPEPVPEPAV
jgi:hypothetical protein